MHFLCLKIFGIEPPLGQETQGGILGVWDVSYLRAALLIFAIHAVFASLGWWIDGRLGAIIGTLIALVFHILVLWKADRVVLRLHNAREVDLDDPNPMVRVYVQECRALADQIGLTRPRTFIVDTHQPNAFVTGRDALHASIAVTTGLLMTLSRQEARAVIAHELAHVKRGDSLAMGVAAAVSAALSRAMWLVLGPIGLARPAARLISRIIAQLSASKSREYAADREAARIVGRPMDLADALEKIERHAMSLLNPTAEKNPATAHLYVIDPLHARKRGRHSSHPATEKRISRLRALAEEMRRQDEHA